MSSLYTVRPANSEKAPFRVNLTAASLLLLKLRPGDLCCLCLPGESTSHRVAIVWENSTTGMKDTVIQTSKFLQELYGLKLGDRVTVQQRSSEKLHDISQVVLRSKVTLSDQDKAFWSRVAAKTVPPKHDVLAISQKIGLELGLEKEEFEVTDIGGPLGRVNQNTTFAFENPGLQPQGAFDLDFPMIGGLEKELDYIRWFVKSRFNPEGPRRFSNYRPKRGLLLYGAKGTGKTLILNKLAECGWSNVVRWNPGVVVSSLHGAQLITIEFNKILTNEKTVSELEALFDSIQETPTIVLAAVRHPNDISERLRSGSLFSTQLEIPIPDVAQRLDILRTLRGNDAEPDDLTLSSLARRTHGFVGDDLHELLSQIQESALKRHSEHSSEHMSEKQPVNQEDAAIISSTDIEEALNSVRPSALQEIFLEKPNVRWSDIGGQHEIKERLQDAIELPLKHPDRMRRLKLVPVKGVLLYGPPGCSKTLTVKALANEADFNFLAVKGAELISMYVGESEKATREVFRKARQASPSIVFFDEIDAIASRGRSGSDLNVLTTLLNEMDGFEELRNVMVVAATNKPESIDPALLRPGRFDSVVYVGPPDISTRKDIFDKQIAEILEMEEGRDWTMEFAQQTEGFSGAEIVAICQGAGWRAFKLGQDIISPEHVLESIAKTPKGITSKMLRSYEDWNAQRMR